MKTTVLRSEAIVSLFFLTQSVTAVLAADTNPPPRLTVDMRDGSRVLGTCMVEKLKFHSALLGDFKLAVTNIRSVEFVATNKTKLVTIDSDSLTVTLADSELPVKTSFGKVELAVDSVRNINVTAVHAFGSYPPGLVALWSGEGNGNDSAGCNNVELHGGVSFAPGKIGQAFAFHSVGDVITAPSTDLPVGSDDRTIDCWIYVETFIPGAEATIASYGNFGSFGAGGHAYTIYFNNHPEHNICFSPWGGALTGPSLDTGRWHNVAVTSSGTSCTTLYVDGISVASGPVNISTPPNSVFRIGQIAEPDCARQFIGQIDEVAVFNRALKAEEIKAIYEQQK